jgi:hypothetical protein
VNSGFVFQFAFIHIRGFRPGVVFVLMVVVRVLMAFRQRPTPQSTYGRDPDPKVSPFSLLDALLMASTGTIGLRETVSFVLVCDGQIHRG